MIDFITKGEKNYIFKIPILCTIILIGVGFGIYNISISKSIGGVNSNRDFLMSIWQGQVAISLLSITLVSLILNSLEDKILGEKILSVLKVKGKRGLSYWELVAMTFILTISNLIPVYYNLFFSMIFILILNFVVLGAILKDTYYLLTKKEKFYSYAKSYLIEKLQGDLIYENTLNEDIKRKIENKQDITLEISFIQDVVKKKEDLKLNMKYIASFIETIVEVSVRTNSMHVLINLVDSSEIEIEKEILMISGKYISSNANLVKNAASEYSIIYNKDLEKNETTLKANTIIKVLLSSFKIDKLEGSKEAESVLNLLAYFKFQCCKNILKMDCLESSNLMWAAFSNFIEGKHSVDYKRGDTLIYKMLYINMRTREYLSDYLYLDNKVYEINKNFKEVSNYLNNLSEDIIKLGEDVNKSSKSEYHEDRYFLCGEVRATYYKMILQRVLDILSLEGRNKNKKREFRQINSEDDDIISKYVKLKEYEKFRDFVNKEIWNVRTIAGEAERVLVFLDNLYSLEVQELCEVKANYRAEVFLKLVSKDIDVYEERIYDKVGFERVNNLEANLEKVKGYIRNSFKEDIFNVIKKERVINNEQIEKNIKDEISRQCVQYARKCSYLKKVSTDKVTDRVYTYISFDGLNIDGSETSRTDERYSRHNISKIKEEIYKFFAGKIIEKGKGSKKTFEDFKSEDGLIGFNLLNLTNEEINELADYNKLLNEVGYYKDMKGFLINKNDLDIRFSLINMNIIKVNSDDIEWLIEENFKDDKKSVKVNFKHINVDMNKQEFRSLAENSLFKVSMEFYCELKKFDEDKIYLRDN